jgi:hypothetical protein
MGTVSDVPAAKGSTVCAEPMGTDQRLVAMAVGSKAAIKVDLSEDRLILLSPKLSILERSHYEAERFN